MESKVPEFGRYAEPSLLILVSLSDGPKHGYAIMQDVELGSGRPMGAGTLYAALARLEEQGLIEPLPPVDRRRPYRLTAVGASNLAEQLRGLSEFAQMGLRQLGKTSPMRSLLIRCYPARWRARYGDEFEAILEERPLGPFDVADVLLGALDAQLRLRGRGVETLHARRFTMSLRIGGIAAIVGASLIVIVVAFTGGLTEGSENVSAIALLVALAALLVALTGMSAFQARSNPWLVWTAFAVTAVGTLAIFIAGVSDLAGVGPTDWRDGLLPFGAVTAALGSATFGIATYRGSVLSRKGALSLVIGPTVGLIGAIAVGQDLWGLGMSLVLVGLVSFLAGWFTLGVAAIRLDRPSTVKPA
jgi:DNA-binding PadR family transcriptional regulator